MNIIQPRLKLYPDSREVPIMLPLKEIQIVWRDENDITHYASLEHLLTLATSNAYNSIMTTPEERACLAFVVRLATDSTELNEHQTNVLRSACKKIKIACQ